VGDRKNRRSDHRSRRKDDEDVGPGERDLPGADEFHLPIRSVMTAMLKMKKLDIAELQKAYAEA
jgi:hypothetical protein